jgi:hypothetical protein
MKTARFVALGAMALFTMAFTFSRPEEEVKGLAIGDKAPLADTQMKGTDENMYSLSKQVGKKGLVVIFSCNTCPFVVGSESFAGWETQYNALYKQATDANVGFILVNSNEAKRDGDDSFEAMQVHVKEKQYTGQMPYVVDEGSALANAFGAKTTPHVYYLDENMQLIYQGAIDNTVDGKRKEDKHYLQDAIKSHVAGKTITENTTPPRGCSIKRVS